MSGSIMKKRLIMLLQLFNERTDEDNPISTTQIMEYFHGEGMSVDRKTLKNDIDLLVEMNYDIVTIKSAPNKYFMGELIFEMPELKLLIDAVQSSRFITGKKSKKLVRKLASLSSKSYAKQLDRHIIASSRVKTSNENVYYIVDAITDAINDKKKISFQYEEYDANKNKVLRNDGEVYVLSPYTLYWNEDFYYVVGYSDKRECITAFRVDHMRNQAVTDEKAEKRPKGFQIDNYSNKIFEMFRGKETAVKLECDNALMKYVIDRFGEEVKTEVVSEGTFEASVQLELSPVFYAWVFQFAGKVRIVSPNEAIEEFKAMLNAQQAGAQGQKLDMK